MTTAFRTGEGDLGTRRRRTPCPAPRPSVKDFPALPPAGPAASSQEVVFQVVSGFLHHQDIRVGDVDAPGVFGADDGEHLLGIGHRVQQGFEGFGVDVVAHVEEWPLTAPSLPLACSCKTLSRTPWLFRPIPRRMQPATAPCLLTVNGLDRLQKAMATSRG